MKLEDVQIRLLELGYDVDLVFDPIVEAYISKAKELAQLTKDIGKQAAKFRKSYKAAAAKMKPKKIVYRKPNLDASITHK